MTETPRSEWTVQHREDPGSKLMTEPSQFAPNGVIYLYDLVIVDQTGRKLLEFPLSDRPFETFSVGDSYDDLGSWKTITRVEHMIVPMARPNNGWLFKRRVTVR
jgi:hypothetical protein